MILGSIMQVLSVTTLYPNPDQIRNGIFVRERLQKLQASGDGVRITVIAPVPWFPFRGRVFGRYGAFARVPLEEQDGLIRVLHPRYLQIPKLGELIAPLTYYLALKRCLQSARIGTFDLIDAHFAFPDGAAAVLLASQEVCREYRIDAILAYIKRNNEASIRLFLRCGFRLLRETHVNGCPAIVMQLNRDAAITAAPEGVEGRKDE